MNNDKSNENVFGFDREKYEKLECWEFCNNTSNLCLFKDSDYEKTYIDKDTGEEKLSWKNYLTIFITVAGILLLCLSETLVGLEIDILQIFG